MKRLLFTVAFIVSLVSASFAQDDESRQQSGLPTYIGNRPGSNPVNGADANLSGSFIIQGPTDRGMTEPTFTLAVLANGTVVSRQRIRNGGSFTFVNVPRSNVSVIAEADGLEIGNFPIGSLNPPPLGNRHDIIISRAQIGAATKRKNDVTGVRSSYPRTDANSDRFEKAMALLKQGRHADAEKEMRAILTADEADYVAWTELGSLLFAADKTEEAEKAYGGALGLRPDFTPALLNLGKLHIKQKKFDPAIEVLTRGLTAAPDSAEVHAFLGEAYLQVKKGSKAVPLLNRAIELDPKGKASLHLRLAQLYVGAKLNDRAAAEYKLFLEKVPDYPQKAELEKFIKDSNPK